MEHYSSPPAIQRFKYSSLCIHAYSFWGVVRIPVMVVLAPASEWERTCLFTSRIVPESHGPLLQVRSRRRKLPTREILPRVGPHHS